MMRYLYNILKLKKSVCAKNPGAHFTLRVTFCKIDTPEIHDPSMCLMFGTCVYHDKKCISSEFQFPCSFSL